jgi:branched-chain amino acid transport system ATP-binding protein
VSALLRVKDLDVNYGAVPAVSRVALEVPAGEIRAILGANGAGKTSTIKAILGLVKAHGTIELEGRSIHGVPTHRIHQLGVAWVPEGRQLFSTLTVHENLEMGAFVRGNGPGFAARVDEIFTLFPRLRERRSQLAGSLSGGEQQMLAIARALISEPRLLIMDEPSRGRAPLRADPGDQRAGPVHPHGRAERAPGAQDRSLRVPARGRSARGRGAVGGADGQRRRPARVPRGVIDDGAFPPAGP